MNENKKVFIGHLSNHAFFGLLEPDTEPGHQAVLVSPADFDGRMLIGAIMGANPDDVTLWRDSDSGESYWYAKHDSQADQRMMNLVDLLSDIRYASPQLMQFTLHGWVLDGTEA